MKGLVYRHRRVDTNEVFYIGMGSSLNRPYSKYGRSQLWRNITNKTDYIVEILATGLSKEDCIELEVFLIQEHDNLCNWTEGGEVGALGYKHTPEALEKISKSSKERKYQRSPQQCEQYRLNRLGKSQPKSFLKVHSLPVLQYSKNDIFIKEWFSAEEAGRVLNINSGNICSCRNGNRKSAGGYVWKHKK